MGSVCKKVEPYELRYFGAQGKTIGCICKHVVGDDETTGIVKKDTGESAQLLSQAVTNYDVG